MSLELKTVIIVAMGKTRRHYSKIREAAPKASVWTLNSDNLSESTMHFDMHTPKNHLDHPTAPMMTPETYPIGPVNTAFNFPYFRCSVSYMIALAIFLRFERIVVVGIDSMGAERAIQSLNIEQWLAIAMTNGVEVLFPDDSNLLGGETHHYYGVKQLTEISQE